MAVRPQRGLMMRRFAPAALVPAGAFAVHQLRYWLAYGSRAGIELQRQGHSYLHSVVPWLVLLLALGVGTFLLALGRAAGGRSSLPRYTLSFATLWLFCAFCLVAIYVSQELLEGLFATGHPAGLAGVFGYGGWWSVPAALAVGLILASAFHGARRMLEAVAARLRHEATPEDPPSLPTRPRPTLRPPLVPLADGWSSRGPPQ